MAISKIGTLVTSPTSMLVVWSKYLDPTSRHESIQTQIPRGRVGVTIDSRVKSLVFCLRSLSVAPFERETDGQSWALYVDGVGPDPDLGPVSSPLLELGNPFRRTQLPSL